MSTSRSKRGAGASGGDDSASPSPTKLTRGALHRDKSLLVALPLLDPEPRKNRKMCRTIRIDHSRGAPALFAEKATAIRAALLAAVEQMEVVINDEDDRAGCFVVREVGGEVFVNLVGMVRPFRALRDLDGQELVTRIVTALLNNVPFRDQD
ncbi:hypothetical protein ACS0TY_035989 [Phlomoides rotata]